MLLRDIAVMVPTGLADHAPGRDSVPAGRGTAGLWGADDPVEGFFANAADARQVGYRRAASPP